jgi:CheY-like chemotaxis protein
MLRHTLLPYFHPTTVCFVDDNQSFLQALCLELPSDLAYRSFNHPKHAIEYLNTPQPLPSLVNRALQIEPRGVSKQIVHLDSTIIEQEISQVDRFKRISVLIVDYAMPMMNGLQLCSYINDRYIRRALLTGVADETTAVEAFNSRLIDRYITKTTSFAMEQMIGYVRELQIEYFAAHSERLDEHLAHTAPGYMKDRRVEDFIFDFIDAENVVEYYQVGDPDGFMLVDLEGGVKRLIIQSAAQMDEQLEFAKRHNAPPDLIQALANHRRVGYFYESPEDYLGNEPFPWPEFMLDAYTVVSDQTWYIGICDEPVLDVDYDPEVSCYRRFLHDFMSAPA